MPEPDMPFVHYGSSSSGGSSIGSRGSTMVIIGDGRSRVRRVVRQTTKHVTVVSYSTGGHKESSTHTSHHATTIG